MAIGVLIINTLLQTEWFITILYKSNLTVAPFDSNEKALGVGSKFSKDSSPVGRNPLTIYFNTICFFKAKSSAPTDNIQV